MKMAEAFIISNQVRAKAVEAKIAAMASHDKRAYANGAGGVSAHPEQSYIECVDELLAISDEINILARAL